MDIANLQEKHLMKHLGMVAEQMAGPEKMPQIEVEKFDDNKMSIKFDTNAEKQQVLIEDNITSKQH